MKFVYEIEGGNFTKSGSGSSEVKKILKKVNVDAKIIKRIVVALFEAEVNVIAHAYSGTMKVFIDTKKINIVIEDKGPGIEDINQAMQVGYSTASAKVREMGFGAGMGLPNMKKNVDFLKVTSELGVGTIVEMITNL